ncbi:MAG: hypothetical protein JSR89_01595 [Proteobacteria bacterium]|nr:hypothetical protein [Pseudomonadota bacterium]
MRRAPAGGNAPPALQARGTLIYAIVNNIFDHHYGTFGNYFTMTASQPLSERLTSRLRAPSFWRRRLRPTEA